MEPTVRPVGNVRGRVEAGETLEQALQHEAAEEAGIRLNGPFVPFASYHWASTDTYTVWFLASVAEFEAIPPGFEKSGPVVCNIGTAKEIIRHLARDPKREERLALLTWAERRSIAGPGT